MMEHIECIPDCYKASKIKIIAQSCMYSYSVHRLHHMTHSLVVVLLLTIME